MNPDGTPNGETNNGEQVSNNAPTTPVIDNTAELAELRKKAEQAEMRARQLENEKRERERADEDARQKQLEEQNEFKTLYQREKEARESLEREREESAKKSAIEAAKSSIFSSYPAEVTEVATAAGLTLFDDSESAKDDLKKRLDVIQSKVTTTTPKKVQGNNGVVSAPSEEDADKKRLLQRMRYDDRSIREPAIKTAFSKLPALDEMRRNAGLNVE